MRERQEAPTLTGDEWDAVAWGVASNAFKMDRSGAGSLTTEAARILVKLAPIIHEAVRLNIVEGITEGNGLPDEWDAVRVAMGPRRG